MLRRLLTTCASRFLHLRQGNNMIHYGLNQSDLQRKHQSHGVFATGKSGLAAACGNGNFHALTTQDKARVTCPACIELLKRS